MALKIFFFSLLILTEGLDVAEDKWDEFSPDVTALHRLRGLSQRITRRRLQGTDPPRENQDPSSWLVSLQRCDDVSACVLGMEQDFDDFLDDIEEQKVHRWLIGAPEVSHSYSQKLLVLTDEEKSTMDRVLQEFSDDPLNSAVIGTGWLRNTSGLPKVDSRTLVKVFGRVSGDGLAVSGLSGSSLADLLLKTPLAAAPVFSVDGNTTRVFQHAFLRVSKARSRQAVLEVNQGNERLYQVMDQQELVSAYQAPQPAGDPSTQYDHQHILILEDDPAVRDAAKYLFEKHPSVSSFYGLDQNHRPKWIYGKQVPLSADSRLVLVGHGVRDGSGEMRLGGFSAQDVSRIIQRSSRVGDAIKTVSVVACEVGSDSAFIRTLLKDLHATGGITTELHVRDAVVQVRHTGDKITQEISPDGVVWKHKDTSKKLVANLDRNGAVVIRNEAGSKGEAVFANERTFLGRTEKSGRSAWPEKPRRFINVDVFEGGSSDGANHGRFAMDQLQELTWGLFFTGQTTPGKIKLDNNQPLKEQFTLAERGTNRLRWIDDEAELRQILGDCYEVKSGEDVRDVVRHLAKNKDNKFTYVMVDDWIQRIDPKSLYALPVGKKLDNNEMGDSDRIAEVRKYINAQVDKENYALMRKQIVNKKEYVKFVRNIFKGNRPRLPASTEAWYVTYFTASVISESSRNLRTFPLTLMALDMDKTDFFFEQHPMARGGSWINEGQRGFTGAADPENPDKLNNLKQVVNLEIDLFMTWKHRIESDEVVGPMAELANKYNVFSDDSHVQSFSNECDSFRETIETQQPRTSGPLGGHEDGHVAPRDLRSAAELETSFKHQSYFLRASASISEEIHVKLSVKYGEHLAKFHVIEETARIQRGEFVCQFMPEGEAAEAEEFRTELSAESRQYSDKLLTSIDSAVGDMEAHGSGPSRGGSQTAEHVGDAVGVLGLMLGMKGALTAFEHGDVQAGWMGALQTTHGVTAMTTAAIARRALSTEARNTEAATAIVRSPEVRSAPLRRTLIAVPIVGVGFGIYNVIEDSRRGDTLGDVDAGLDLGMVALDLATLAAPELAPLSLALSVARLAIDDVYVALSNGLGSLPANAGFLQRLGAAFVGVGRGSMHFAIRVANLFYDWGYEEIENGRKLVASISDYHDYYKVITLNGRNVVDFTAGSASWNGGNIEFWLADEGPSLFCTDNFASNDGTKKCSSITTEGIQDIVLGVGESHVLHTEIATKKLFVLIPVGSERVVSGYDTSSNSRFGNYSGNRHSNCFFAVQKLEDADTMDVMLRYFYHLYGGAGDDIFFLGPQKSYVEGSGGKDTYVIPEEGGKTVINNYDPSKELDALHFSVNYSDISVSKSENDVVLTYESNHTVTIQNWFSGELYRHMTLLSGDGVLFEISSAVTSDVRLVARGINKMLAKKDQIVDASQPLLQTVTNIHGSPFDDKLSGNAENNLIDGGGGRDHLIGGEGEDVYLVKTQEPFAVVVDNYATDNKRDVLVMDAYLHSFRLTVRGDDAFLTVQDNAAFSLTLTNWFRSPADRHLVLVARDLVAFSISENKADCQRSGTFPKCLKSHCICSCNNSALRVDLQEDPALRGVTEIHGTNSNDVLKGNKEHNVFRPERGDDKLEGRGGQDWYILTPGPDSGLKTINNLSPDMDVDLLFLKEKYRNIVCSCLGQSVSIMINDSPAAVLENWFVSKNHQHLRIRTSDGITAGLKTDRSSCGGTLLLPLTVDHRNHRPETLRSSPSNVQEASGGVACYTYRSSHSRDKRLCGKVGTVMRMEDLGSVEEMFGSEGFDVMVGNLKENRLDPFTGGALMCGGEGKDTYVIERGYGPDVLIDNFAEDESIDTILVDMDYLHGGQVRLDSRNEDLVVTILTKEEALTFTLLDFRRGSKFQHLQFQSSDGVHFKLKPNDAKVPPFQAEAFKVTLKQPEVDCYLDLGSQRNLSRVHTVHGCSSQSNLIVGNDQDNALIGGLRKDMLHGGDGDDTLIGGQGNDDLIGGLGDDTLYGNDGDDTLMGNSGRDVFVPGMGADVMDGGPGRDTVVYLGDHQKREGVYVNLLTGQGRRADAEGDVLKDVETVIGTIYSDVLVAGYESSLLKGSDGNDVLVSTGGDYLVGGDGSDIYLLASQNASVTIDNCAEDNAVDILYLNAHSTLDCQVLADRVVLNLYGLNQMAAVTLQGWTSDHDDCGHLTVEYRGAALSVDQLLLECRREESPIATCDRASPSRSEHSMYSAPQRCDGRRARSARKSLEVVFA